MEVHETFYHTKALNFKTPAKRERGSDDTLSPAPSLLDVSVYSPFFKDNEVAPITDIDHVSGILARLDGGITANNAAIINFIDDYKGEHGKAGDSIWSMWLRLEALTSTVGRVPSRLASDYLSPSAWASIGALTDTLAKIKQSQTTQSVRLESYKTENTSTMQQHVKLSRKDFYQRLDTFKTAFISATRGLGGPLDNVKLKLIGMVDNSIHGSLQERQEPRRNSIALLGQSATANPLPESFTGGQTQNDAILLDESDTGHKVARVVEHRVDLMEQKVHLIVVAKSDERAIWFAGLDFQSSSDSNARLETELQNHQSGLIVNAHMVFENLYHTINGINTLGTMEKLYKIKISCISGSVAITSFDNKMPKYFSTIKGHHVLRNNSSYFDSIISHSDWAT
jgi:hypothetical protein